MSGQSSNGGANAAISEGWLGHRDQIVRYDLTDWRPDGRLGARILVVVPCHNAERWIPGCLAALARNAEPHDILVVDNGPRPAAAVIEPRANLVLCRIHHEVGLVAALNFAAIWALEQGYDFYVRQDADDFSRPDRLSKQRALIEDTNADMAVAAADMVDLEGRRLWRAPVMWAMRDLSGVLRERNPFVHSTWFLRTSAFLRVGCYDPAYRGAEDFELVQRLHRRGRIVGTDEVLVDYLVHGGSVLSNSRIPALNTVRVLLKYFDGRRWRSYRGLMRAIAAVLVSRRLKTRARAFLAGARA